MNGYLLFAAPLSARENSLYPLSLKDEKTSLSHGYMTEEIRDRFSIVCSSDSLRHDHRYIHTLKQR